MEYYEIAISVKDEQDLASGHKRKKEGDIVAIIHPATMPHGWGRKVIDEYLIVPVCSESTYHEMIGLMIEHFEGGLDVYPSLDVVAPPILAKHRFKIPLETIRDGWCPDMDLDKVQNKKYIYQPLMKESEIIRPFTGIDGRYLLESKDVDCNTSIFSPEDHVVLDMSEKVAICFDKEKLSFKYSTVKVF